MTFDKYLGYPLKFIQKQRCTDESSHLFTEIYKFHSPETKFNYIVRAEYHDECVFAVKFYVQQHSKSDFKYHKITNKGDLGNILITCLRVIPLLLQKYPDSSFAFIASPSIDLITKKVEPLSKNQRFNTYTYFISQKIGAETFEHIAYTAISGYMLLNRKAENLEEKETAIKQVFTSTYPKLLEII